MHHQLDYNRLRKEFQVCMEGFMDKTLTQDIQFLWHDFKSTIHRLMESKKISNDQELIHIPVSHIHVSQEQIKLYIAIETIYSRSRAPQKKIQGYWQLQTD